MADKLPVKKCKIINMYEVLLYCRMCGTRMPEGVFKYERNPDNPADFSNNWYAHTCPACGYVHNSRVKYPHQQVEFDEGGGKLLEDAHEVLNG